MTTVEPESAFESPVDGSIAGSKGKPLFLKRYEHPNAQYTLVLVHGTAGYSEAYHDFAEQFRRHYPATVWAFDLTGHGRTPGPRGVFTFEDFLEDVRAVCDHDFAEQFRRHYPATVWAFDLTGHGRTPGPRGVFTFEDFLEDVRAVCDH